MMQTLEQQSEARERLRQSTRPVKAEIEIVPLAVAIGVSILVSALIIGLAMLLFGRLFAPATPTSIVPSLAPRAQSYQVNPRAVIGQAQTETALDYRLVFKNGEES